MHHRQELYLRASQREKRWAPKFQWPAGAISVGIMGLGGMGTQVATRLRDNGFSVSAWARSAHVLPEVHTFAGCTPPAEFLALPDMVVCLLPLTAQTTGLCNAEFFAAMKPGAAFVSAGRGQQVVTGDLIAALDAGQLRGAVLDVFDAEPLSPHSPLWSHPKVIVTPHMASAATDTSIARQIVANVQRVRGGHAIENTVTRKHGY